MAHPSARSTGPHRPESGPGRHRGGAPGCQRAPGARDAADAGASRPGLAGGATGPAHAAGLRLRPRLARRPDRRTASGRHRRRGPGARPVCAPAAFTAPSLPRSRPWTSTPVAPSSTTIPATPLRTWPAILPLAMAASIWPGTCRASAASRASPCVSLCSLTGFPLLLAWMRCAPSAAALAPGLEARGSHQRRSPWPTRMAPFTAGSFSAPWTAFN